MQNHQSASSTLVLLQSQFNNALLIKPAAAGLVVGLKPQSTYNLLVKKAFPLPCVTTTHGKMVRLSDLADYIDSLQTLPSSLPASAAGGRGRPHKAEQIEAKRLGLSVRELRAQSSMNMNMNVSGVQS